eukprot:c20254_g1_i1 orf=72-1838(+)
MAAAACACTARSAFHRVFFRACSPRASLCCAHFPAFGSLLPSSRLAFARQVSMASSISVAPPASIVSTVGLTTPAAPFLPEIDFCTSETDATEWKGDILVLGVSPSDLDKDQFGAFENLKLKKLDELLGGLLGAVITEEDFCGKVGQSTFVRLPGFGFKRVGLIGLGKLEGIPPPRVWKKFGEAIAAAAKVSQASSVAVTLVSAAEELDEVSVGARASAITAGVVLGTHEDTRFKTDAKKPTLKSLELLGLGKAPGIGSKLQKTGKVCEGVLLTRQLVNAPANVVTPCVLAEEASNIAAASKDVLTVKVYNEEECKEMKMGAYLGVAAASANPPRFIHIQYKPPTGDIMTKLAIVGKGLTFDSGGYNIKTGPGCNIELMKYDMGGAAATFGAAKAIAAIQPLGVEVNFIVAACENMISGGGMRPGDILTASNGKTIEVNNTDAEGRLTLADALVYACKQGVDKIVDLATLTGACVIALGSEIGGLFTPSDDLAMELIQASEKAGEKLWRMPMEESYWEAMKSGIADMVNTGGRPGGSITASLFLKQFVDENVQWAHLDVAGPVWSEKKKCATGYPVATLVEWVLGHTK